MPRPGLPGPTMMKKQAEGGGVSEPLSLMSAISACATVATRPRSLAARAGRG